MTNVLVIGDAILDLYQYGEINRQSPEDNSIPVVDIVSEEYRLGGCMNVAANIRSISSPAFASKAKSFNVSLSSIFSEFTGKKLWEKSIRCDDSCMSGYDVNFSRPSQIEIIKTRIVNKKTNKQIVRVDNRKKYRKEDIEHYKELSHSIEDVDAIVVSDYAKGLIDDRTLEKLKKFKGPIFIDTKNPDLTFWNDLENCFIKINEKEWLIAKDNSTEKSIHPLIVTMGAKGAVLWYYWGENTSSGLPYDIVPYPTNPVNKPDVVGCGDVFLAGLVVSYMRHKDLPMAIEFANMCAGISAKQQGTTEVYL